MGDKLSSYARPTESCIDSEQPVLTRQEAELLELQRPLFTRFHESPTAENYASIRENDSLYYKALGEQYRMYLWAIRHHHPGLAEPLAEAEELDYLLLVDRLLDLRNVLLAKDLDLLWALFYVTGDDQLVYRVISAANNPLQGLSVGTAARWSYTSHQRQGLVD